MKVRFLLLMSTLIVLLMSVSLSAQSPGYLWAKNAGGNNYDEGVNITTDAGGNVFVTGYFLSASITFGAYTLANANAGSADIFLVKYDASGNVLWAKSAGGMADDYGQSVSTDAAGDSYVTGYYNSSSMTIDTGTLANAGANDIFLIKYDPAGNLLWKKSVGGGYDDNGRSVSTDTYGNVFITGDFASSAINFGGDTLINASAGTADVFVVKYDASGNLLWGQRAGGAADDIGQSLATDAYGNVFLTGFFYSHLIKFGTIILSDTSGGYSDAFVVRYDNAGNVFWAKRAGGVYYDYGQNICTDTSGNVLVTGYYNSPDILFDSTSLTNGGNNDVFVAKYDPWGTLLWAKSAGGIYYDEGMGVSTDADNNVVVTGYFESTNILFGTAALTNAGGADMFIVKYDASGNVLWAKATGGPYDEKGQSIVADGSGNVFLTGYFTSPSVTFGADVIGNAGGEDIFIAKLDHVTGIMESTGAGNSMLTIYPNPSDGIVYIASDIAISAIEVVNLLGEKVAGINNKKQTSPQLLIDLSDQPDGIYFVVLTTEKESITKKIIVSN